MSENLPGMIWNYDPQEPLVAPWGTVIAARNAVSALINLLNDTVDPPSNYRQKVLRMTLPTAVRDDQPGTLASYEEVLPWLIDLRDQLTGLLPGARSL